MPGLRIQYLNEVNILEPQLQLKMTKFQGFKHEKLIRSGLFKAFVLFWIEHATQSSLGFSCFFKTTFCQDSVEV